MHLTFNYSEKWKNVISSAGFKEVENLDDIIKTFAPKGNGQIVFEPKIFSFEVVRSYDHVSKAMASAGFLPANTEHLVSYVKIADFNTSRRISAIGSVKKIWVNMRNPCVSRMTGGGVRLSLDYYNLGPRLTPEHFLGVRKIE